MPLCWGANLDCRLARAKRIQALGFPEKKTLAGIAANGPKKIILILGLDPFGDNEQPKGVGKVNQSLHDRRAAGGAAEIGHKGLVDLDLMERKVAQVCQ